MVEKFIHWLQVSRKALYVFNQQLPFSFPFSSSVKLTSSIVFFSVFSGECLVCSLKLCEQISTSNQGLLLFECGELVKYLDQTPNSRDLFTRQCVVARGENLKNRILGFKCPTSFV